MSDNPQPAALDATKELVLDTICKGRKIILRHARPDSCILTTRMAVRAAGHYGIELQPVHVYLSLFNPWATRQIELYHNEHGRWPDGHELERICKSPKGHSIGLGIPPVGQGPQDVGHVIALGSGIFLDASIDQAARPLKRINVYPFWYPYVNHDATARFLEQKENIVVTLEGCILIYKLETRGINIKTSADWRLDTRTDEAVNWVTRNVDAKLKKMGISK